MSALVGFAMLACLCKAFSIPGLVPTNYKKGDNIPILAG